MFIYELSGCGFESSCSHPYKDFLEIQELGFDVSFLKVLQLLIDGDIESNAGPFTGTPKSRKAKKKKKNI